jgi:hypothetical protein
MFKKPGARTGSVGQYKRVLVPWINRGGRKKGTFYFFLPRTARASVGGICYRVINRGNRRQEVFVKPAITTAVSTSLDRACEPGQWIGFSKSQRSLG